MAEAAEVKRSYIRSQYFIKKDFQREFIIKFCLVLLAGIFLSTVLLFFLSQDSLTSSFANSRLEIQNTGRAILPAVLLTNLITLGIVSCFSFMVMIFISHRIAGPLFRFEKDLKRVSEGDLRVRIHLRKKDQLTDMSAALNQMIQSMHEKVSHIDARLSRIEDLCDPGAQAGQEISRLRTEIRNQFHLNR